jgi:hypothetical protein
VVAVAVGIAACGNSASPAGSSPPSDVRFEVACTLTAACGGDPKGAWDITTGCVDTGATCATQNGSISGAFIFDGATFSLSQSHNYTACDRHDSHSSTDSGRATVVGSKIDLGQYAGAYDFCVDHDTLTFTRAGKSFPDVSVVVFTRRLADAGAGG